MAGVVVALNGPKRKGSCESWPAPSESIERMSVKIVTKLCCKKGAGVGRGGWERSRSLRVAIAKFASAEWAGQEGPGQTSICLWEKVAEVWQAMSSFFSAIFNCWNP